MNFLKTFGLSLIIIIGLFCFIQSIPASSIKISGEEYKEEVGGILPLTQTTPNSEMNILLLGQPGAGYSGGQLTDTIIIAHLEPEEKAVLISLPRDLLVSLPGENNFNKINSLYYSSGIEALKTKIEEISQITIDHYVLVDLMVIEEIIDLIDGLNVYVAQDINDPYFPGPNYSRQTFLLKSGWRYLDGPTTLKYIRTRYTSPNGDFDRMARQQQIIHLIKQKVLDLNLLWDLPTYLKIFHTLQEHIKTDLSLMEIKNLYQTVRQIEPEEISHLVIDKKRTDLLVGGLVPFGQQMASVVYPKAGQENYQEIKEYIKDVVYKD